MSHLLQEATTFLRSTTRPAGQIRRSAKIHAHGMGCEATARTHRNLPACPVRKKACKNSGDMADTHSDCVCEARICSQRTRRHRHQHQKGIHARTNTSLIDLPYWINRVARTCSWKTDCKRTRCTGLSGLYVAGTPLVGGSGGRWSAGCHNAHARRASPFLRDRRRQIKTANNSRFDDCSLAVDSNHDHIRPTRCESRRWSASAGHWIVATCARYTSMRFHGANFQTYL